MKFQFWRKKSVRFGKKGIIIAGLIMAFVAIVAVRSMNRVEVVQEEEVVPAVSLIDLSTYEENTSQIKAQGEVESSAQVDLQAEVSARITSMPVVLGQQVFSGQIIATFDSGELVARLQQAEADLAAAQAGLNSAKAAYNAQVAQLRDLQEGGRPEQVAIAEEQLDTAEDALEKLYTGTQNALEGIVASVEDLIYNQVDELFDDPNSMDPLLDFSTSRQSNKIIAQSNRADLNTLLPEWSDKIRATDASSALSVERTLQLSEENLLFIQSFLQSLSAALSEEVSLSDAEENAFRSIVTGGRNTISTHLNTVRTREQSIDSQVSAVSQASDQLELTRQGASKNQIQAQEAIVEQSLINVSSQEANIKRAQGAINGIQSDLSKRAIRSPISGTIATLPFRVGELVSPGSLVATVVNVDGLQVKAFIDGSAASSVSVGAPVQINSEINGVISTISPSIDPTTRKVEVGVIVTDEDTKLVVGQFVDIAIQKDNAEEGVTLLPLRAIDVSTEGSFVYTVENDLLVRHQVSLGRVVGESVEVYEGLETLNAVVSSIRGLNEGDRVTIR